MILFVLIVTKWLMMMVVTWFVIKVIHYDLVGWNLHWFSNKWWYYTVGSDEYFLIAYFVMVWWLNIFLLPFLISNYHNCSEPYFTLTIKWSERISGKVSSSLMRMINFHLLIEIAVRIVELVEDYCETRMWLLTDNVVLVDTVCRDGR